MLRATSLLCAASALLASCADIEGEEPIDDVDELAAVAPRGAAATLDIANWNIEFFGDTGNGPTSEPLQFANVRDAIVGTDFDVWALEEVSSGTAFRNLVTQLPGYAGIIANDATVTGGTGSYSANEQKPALVWKTSLATLVSARIILAANNTDFAGRPPLEVRLSIRLNGVTQERIFIVLHMKAFADAESRQRRARASTALKAFLDSTFPTQRVIVLGDWNDDLDTSITSGQPTPYANFVGDPVRYTFTTRPLTDARIATTCDFSDAIDHQMVTNELAGDRIASSVEAYDLELQIPNYCDTTSDHLPVLVRYAFGGNPPPPPGQVIINEIMANEPGASTGGEYIELVNTGSTSATLSGFQLLDAAGVRHTFASGTTIAAGRSLVVFGSAASIPAGTPSAIGSSTGSLSLNNTGDSVTLRSNTGSTIDSTTYQASLASIDGVSANRNPDATVGTPFVLHTSVSSLSASPGRRASGASF
jgi:endonuclease/exonuclease/phosphatase family metal-dependent hydrolase